jgi:hypothetical protein
VARFFRRDAPSALTAADADADGDGVSNWVEYVFGSSPVIGASVPRAEWRQVRDGDLDYPAIQFRQRAGVGDVVYRVQVSADLVTWEDNTTGAVTAVVSISAPDAEGMETVTVRSLRPIASVERQFLRACADASAGGDRARQTQGMLPVSKSFCMPLWPRWEAGQQLLPQNL